MAKVKVKTSDTRLATRLAARPSATAWQTCAEGGSHHLLEGSTGPGTKCLMCYNVACCVLFTWWRNISESWSRHLESSRCRNQGVGVAVGRLCWLVLVLVVGWWGNWRALIGAQWRKRKWGRSSAASTQQVIDLMEMISPPHQGCFRIPEGGTLSSQKMKWAGP